MDIKVNHPQVDGDHQQHIAGQNLRVSDIVYVLSLRGKPLMPCGQQKSRKLLKGGKAKVVKRFPFTIQLTKASGETKQKVVLGVDTGFGNKKYISNGIKNSGRYITFRTLEKKNYLKVEDVTKIFHFGSFCFQNLKLEGNANSSLT